MASRYFVNGFDVTSLIVWNGLSGTYGSFSNFPSGSTSALNSTFEVQRLPQFTLNGASITKSAWFVAPWTDYTINGNIQNYELNYTNRPSWANHMNVVCIGAGGGGGAGGNGSSNNGRGGGSGGSGGSGGYISNSYSTPIQLYQYDYIYISVGKGGAAGYGAAGLAGGTGEATVFRTTGADVRMVAYGGGGGAGGNNAGGSDGNGGAGGTKANTSIYTSFNGGTAPSNISFNAWDGNNGIPGNGGNAGNAGYSVAYKMNTTSNYPSGFNQGSSGAGGEGGTNNATAAQGGYAGANGIVRIYWLGSNNIL
jgi:hypothetical protein